MDEEMKIDWTSQSVDDAIAWMKQTYNAPNQGDVVARMTDNGVTPSALHDMRLETLGELLDNKFLVDHMHAKIHADDAVRAASSGGHPTSIGSDRDLKTFEMLLTQLLSMNERMTSFENTFRSSTSSSVPSRHSTKTTKQFRVVFHRSLLEYTEEDQYTFARLWPDPSQTENKEKPTLIDLLNEVFPKTFAAQGRTIHPTEVIKHFAALFGVVAVPQLPPDIMEIDPDTSKYGAFGIEFKSLKETDEASCKRRRDTNAVKRARKRQKAEEDVLMNDVENEEEIDMKTKAEDEETLSSLGFNEGFEATSTNGNLEEDSEMTDIELPSKILEKIEVNDDVGEAICDDGDSFTDDTESTTLRQETFTEEKVSSTQNSDLASFSKVVAVMRGNKEFLPNAKLQREFRELGGTIGLRKHGTIKRRITHIIAPPVLKEQEGSVIYFDGSSPSARILEVKNCHHARVVTQEWVKECVRKKALVDTEPYLVPRGDDDDDSNREPVCKSMTEILRESKWIEQILGGLFRGKACEVRNWGQAYQHIVMLSLTRPRLRPVILVSSFKDDEISFAFWISDHEGLCVCVAPLRPLQLRDFIMDMCRGNVGKLPDPPLSALDWVLSSGLDAWKLTAWNMSVPFVQRSDFIRNLSVRKCEESDADAL